MFELSINDLCDNEKEQKEYRAFFDFMDSQGKSNYGLKSYKRLLNESQNSLNYLLQIGRGYRKQKNFEAANKFASKALSKDSSDYRGYLLKANILADQELYEECMYWVNAARKLTGGTVSEVNTLFMECFEILRLYSSLYNGTVFFTKIKWGSESKLFLEFKEYIDTKNYFRESDEKNELFSKMNIRTSLMEVGIDDFKKMFPKLFNKGKNVIKHRKDEVVRVVNPTVNGEEIHIGYSESIFPYRDPYTLHWLYEDCKRDPETGKFLTKDGYHIFQSFGVHIGEKENKKVISNGSVEFPADAKIHRGW